MEVNTSERYFRLEYPEEIELLNILPTTNIVPFEAAGSLLGLIGVAREVRWTRVEEAKTAPLGQRESALAAMNDILRLDDMELQIFEVTGLSVASATEERLFSETDES